MSADAVASSGFAVCVFAVCFLGKDSESFRVSQNEYIGFDPAW